MTPQEAVDHLANFINHPSAGDDNEADAIEAVGVLQSAVANSVLLFDRLAHMEDLLHSIELDFAGYNPESKSCPVIGNVDLTTLLALDVPGAKTLAPPKPRKQKFYAYEIATDGAYELGAFFTEAGRDAALRLVRSDLLRFCEDVETEAIGEVWAETRMQALDLIRAGHWEYSQKL